MSPCAHDIDILTLKEQCLAFWYSKRITVLGKSFISSCLNNMQFCPTRAGSLMHCAILTTNDMDLKKRQTAVVLCLQSSGVPKRFQRSDVCFRIHADAQTQPQRFY